jgi:hypothetical protein
MSDEAWYNPSKGFTIGLGGLKQEEDKIAAKQGASRVWIPANGKKDLVFIDDEFACIHEHNPKMHGHWRNWMTCLNGFTEDKPCCEILGPNTRYYVGYLTVIDCSEYTDKKGNKYQYEVKLFPARMKTLKKFRRKKEDRGSLVGCLFQAIREDDKSPNCGDEFEYVRTANLDEVFEVANYRGKKLKEIYAKARSSAEDMERLKRVFQLSFDDKGKLLDKIVPFNYFEMLKPTHPKELRLLLKAGAVERSEGGEDTESAKTDDTPF